MTKLLEIQLKHSELGRRSTARNGELMPDAKRPYTVDRKLNDDGTVTYTLTIPKSDLASSHANSSGHVASSLGVALRRRWTR